MDLISVVVPFYNVEKYLVNRVVNGLLEQSYHNLQIILVDDGSAMKYRTILDGYPEIDRRVEVIHSENHGVSSARNIGLNSCKGEYVTFVDADDIVSKDYVSNLFKVLIETNSDCSLCSCEYFSNYNDQFNLTNSYSVIKVNRNEALQNLFYNRQPFPGLEVTSVWGTLYKKEILTDVYFDENLNISEDFIFNFNVLQKVDSVAYIDAKYYGYFIHINSAMRSGFNKKHMKSFDRIIVLLKDLQASDEEIVEGFIVRCVNIAIVLYLMIPVDTQEFSICKKEIQSFIIKYRKKILLNRKVKFKLKISLLISYASFYCMQRLFEIIC